MKVSEELLAEANEVLVSNREVNCTESVIASPSCSGCGWGCSGIVGD